MCTTNLIDANVSMFWLYGVIELFVGLAGGYFMNFLIRTGGNK